MAIITEIPGISRIQAVRPGVIPADALERARVGLPVLIAGDVVEIDFLDEPRCKSRASADLTGRVYETTLTFNVSELPSLPLPAAWLIYDRYGRCILLGSPDFPQPEVVAEKDSGLLRDRKSMEVKIRCITYPAPVTPLVTVVDKI